MPNPERATRVGASIAAPEEVIKATSFPLYQPRATSRTHSTNACAAIGDKLRFSR